MLPPTPTQLCLVWIKLKPKIFFLCILQFLSDLKYYCKLILGYTWTETFLFKYLSVRVNLSQIQRFIVNFAKATGPDRQIFKTFHEKYSILNPTFPTPSTFPFKATELYNPKWITNECVLCVVIWHLFHILDRKYRVEISVCLINDHSLIA